MLDPQQKNVARDDLFTQQAAIDTPPQPPIDALKLIDHYVDESDWKVKENSNMGYSLQGLNNFIANEVIKEYWLTRIYSPAVANAHQQGFLHLHDLGTLGTYCVGWDLRDILLRGFGGVANKITSAPAKHFRTALGQIVNFFYTLQGESAGAQALANVDTFLAPFIAHDKLDEAQVTQALQEFVFNMNVPTRVGFQTPFTNMTLDLTVPQSLRDEPVIIGGQPQDTCYKDYQTEMDTFNRALLRVMSKGDHQGRLFAFPILTYNVTRDFDWENPNIAELWGTTAKYGLAYFANFVNSDMSPDDARSMCCRLRLDKRELARRGGGLFGAGALTGSVGVVTLNLPRMGYLAHDKESFMAMLQQYLALAYESLEVKRAKLEAFTAQNLYPYAKHYLSHVHQRFGKYWQNHFSTIGIIGMNECLRNLLGMDIASDEGKAYACEILDWLREQIADQQELTGNLYNLEATPAEGVTYRFARLDRRAFPDIITANKHGEAGYEPYYTNSTHLPVHHTEDVFETLDHQDDLQRRYTGGTVVHVFVGEKLTDAGSVKQFIRKVCENYHVPYFTITPTFSICPQHGYMAGEHAHCPHCSASCEVYSRVVGYYSPVQRWNKGKQQEFAERLTYSPRSFFRPTQLDSKTQMGSEPCTLAA